MVVFLVGIAPVVVLVSGVLILISVGVLVGSGTVVASGAVVVVVHDLCVYNLRTLVSSGSSFCRIMPMQR